MLIHELHLCSFTSCSCAHCELRICEQAAVDGEMAMGAVFGGQGLFIKKKVARDAYDTRCDVESSAPYAEECTSACIPTSTHMTWQVPCITWVIILVSVYIDYRSTKMVALM